jgi:magnesium chelatase subunit H
VILGIDAAQRVTGWALLDDQERLVTTGTIVIDGKDEDRRRAFSAVRDELVSIGRMADAADVDVVGVFVEAPFAGPSRKVTVEKKSELLQSVLADVVLTYQNLDSVELGVTTVDQYFDTLGGISRAVRRARKEAVPVYIGDQTSGPGVVRTLNEQVALEARTRILNPKWYEGMLKHGYEGVRQIEEHVANTVGWSATTGEVAPWVYQQVTELYVLDPAMRERLAALNTTASARLANRLIEAHQRNYWTPDQETLDALHEAGEALEDRLEGVVTPANTAGRAA